MSKKHLHADAGGWWCAKLGAADRRDLILNFCELTVARKGTHFSTYSSVRKRFKLFYVDSSKQTLIPTYVHSSLRRGNILGRIEWD